MTTLAVRTIRIFVSSPGDVSEERDRAKQVIESLRRRYLRKFILKPVLWEDLALQADMSFQQGIERVLSEDQGIDVAVFILWSRLGSPIGPRIVRDDGTEYLSGTERELYLMRKAHRQSGGLRPTILIYTRKDEKSFEERLRGQPTAEKEELISQKLRVEAFIDETSRDADTGHNTSAYHSFDRPVTFSQRLRVHLIELLDKLAGETTEIVWDIDKQGPPYLGLSSFQPEHAEVFFGREEETLEIRFALREQAKQACAFLLLTGASGSGKSSLARSGVLPDIVQNELDDQVAAWRWLIITPAELAPDPILSLLERLATPEIWPDLRRSEDLMEKLGRGLRENPRQTFDIGIQPAIEKLAERENGHVRLFIVIDQLEEMFASHVMTAADRSAFLGVIDAMAHCGSVWILATARSDFFHKIQDEPLLVRLLEGRGPVPVMPPSPDGLQRLIEEPARLAGLQFEVKNGVSLSSRILRDAAAHVELLPLLEFVLRELFEICRNNGILTFSAYEHLGGIEGSLGKQAEGMFQDLPIESQSALSEILPLLVTVENTGEQPAVRRRSSLDELRANPAKELLTDRLIVNRFLTTDRQDNVSVASFAHEALLRRWERIVSWIHSNREHLRIRSRILAAVTNWEKHDRRKDLLLSAGKPMDEANELAACGMTLDKIVVEYIQQSHSRVRRNASVRRLAISSLAVLTILSVIASGVAWRAQQDASESLEQAKNSETELKQQLYDNSIAIAEREITQNQDIGKASILLDGNTCPENLRGWEWYYLMRLRDGSPPPLADHKTGLWGAEFSPDGTLIATCSIDGTLKIWDSTTLQVIRSIDADEFEIDTHLLESVGMSRAPLTFLVLKIWNSFTGQHLHGIGASRLVINHRILQAIGIPRMPIMCLSFSPDGKKIATGSFRPMPKWSLNSLWPPKPDRDSPGLVRIWDVATGRLDSEFQDQKGVVLSLSYSPDGQRIASSSINPDNSFAVWNVNDSKLVKRVYGHKSQLHRLRYSPDGLIIAAGETDGVVKLWNANTLTESISINAHSAPVIGLSFSPIDHNQFASSGEDGLIRIWQMDTGKMLHDLEGHAGAALDVRYSPDGKRVASTGFDKTVRLWDAANGKEKITLRGHNELVWSVAFSQDGLRLVSASFDNTARIWDASPRVEVHRHGEFVVSGHTERVNTVALRGDHLVSGSWDRTIRIWNSNSGKEVSVLKGHEGTIWCVAISPDGRQIASASWDHTARIWDRESGKLLLTFSEHTAPVHSVAFSPDGTRVASGAFDGQLKIWDSANGKVIASCDGFIFPVMAVAFSPDGRHVASGGSDRAVKVWDAETGKLLLTIPAHKASIHAIAYSPDGNQVASGSWDHTVRIWDVALGGKPSRNRELAFFEHTDRVNGIAFSTDGQQIASASEDKTVRIWDSRSGKESVPPYRHRAVVWSVAFANDEKRLVTASWEKGAWIHAFSLGME